jgi:hypothetical protein
MVGLTEGNYGRSAFFFFFVERGLDPNSVYIYMCVYVYYRKFYFRNT